MAEKSKKSTEIPAQPKRGLSGKYSSSKKKAERAGVARPSAFKI
jgi:hypothetical protein